MTPGYFEAMGVKLVRGRFFDERDAAVARERRHRRPAHRARLDHRRREAREALLAGTGSDRPPHVPAERHQGPDRDHRRRPCSITVVGVIADIKLHDSHRGRASRWARTYFPMDQDTSTGMTFAVKTAGDPLSLTSAVRGALNGLDRELPVFDTQTMDAADRRSRWSAGARRSLLSLELRRRRAVPVGDRHLRRARVSRDAAAEGDRHPHRARQQRAEHLRAGAARGARC